MMVYYGLLKCGITFFAFFWMLKLNLPDHRLPTKLSSFKCLISIDS